MSQQRPNRRVVAAAATRAEVVSAARRLFATQGYTSTSIQQVADEAGVAVQTVYSSVGSKGALVLALNDLIDDEAGVAEAAAAVASASDPAEMIAAGVRLTRQLNERCGDLLGVLLSAQAAEPDVAAAVADGMRRHRAGLAELCAGLGARNVLAPGMTVESATETLVLMTAPSSWRELTEEAGWSFDEAEAFLVRSLTTLILDVTSDGGHGSG